MEGPTVNLGRVVRNIGSSYVGAFANGLVLLLLTPLVISYLGARDYGLWVLTASIGSYLGFLNAGSGPAAVRSVASLAGTGRIGEASRAVGSVFRIYLVIGMVACLSLVAVSFTALSFFHISAESQVTARGLLLLIALNFLVSFPMGVTRGVLAGLHRFQALNVVEVGMAVFRMGATILLLTTGYGLLALGTVQLVASVGGHLARWGLVRRLAPEIRITGGAAWKGLTPGVPLFSALSFGYESIKTLFEHADILLIGILAGPSAVGVFGVGTTLASFVSKALQPISGVLFPMASHLEARGEKAESARMLEVGTRFKMALVLPMVTLLLFEGPNILGYWVGAGFEESIPVLLAFAAIHLVTASSSTSATFLFGSGRVGTLLRTEAFRYLLNVGLVLLGYRMFGFKGVALATLVAVMGVDLYLVISRACPVVGLEPMRFLARAVGGPLASAVPVAIVMAAWAHFSPQPSLSGLILRGGICVGGFVLMYALSGVFREERRLMGRAWVEVFR